MSESSRLSIQIKPGAYVRREAKVYRIVEVLDFATVVGVDVETGRSASLPIAALQPAEETRIDALSADLEEIADVDWRRAEARFAAIEPLANRLIWGRSEVEERAREVGVSPATLYRWLKRYRATGSVLSLVPQKRGWREGKGRISPFAERVIEEVIRDYYLTPQRPTAQKTILEVRRRCLEQSIDPPSPGAIRARLARIPERERLWGRHQKEKARNRYTPTPGSFPHADYPLAVVQIDHTQLDLVLVDDRQRKPVGRPWLTLAIDVYSRMVTGYYLSFDPPSETSVAMCVAHSVLPKEEWLRLHKVDADWPVWGLPRTIHVDNGPDFRSEGFRQACLAYGIHLEFRPVARPRYGGHIERTLGSFLKEIHTLPGTTFSSVKEREDYDPDRHAALTLNEFEEWLVHFICKVYHQRLHHGIGMTPLKKWELGIFGEGDKPGVGLPRCPSNRQGFLLDFLPSFRRTVQTFGVTIDGLTYYAEALRPWINAEDPEHPGKKRTLIFRRDPRDISAIWFRDPRLQEYFKVPLADQSLPPMSLWEYRKAREWLRAQGVASVNETQVLRAITELREKVEASREKTRKARLQAQRRSEHARKSLQAAQPSPAPEEAPPGLLEEVVEPFEEIS